MDNVKDDKFYLEKVVLDIKFLIKHTQNITREELEKDEVLLDSIMFRFIQISELIKKLTYEFRIKNSTIPWKNIIGLKNKMIHEYGNIDLDIIYSTLKKDLFEILYLLQSSIE
jgi:uncharacterized protein with HEPN domain